MIENLLTIDTSWTDILIPQIEAHVQMVTQILLIDDHLVALIETLVILIDDNAALITTIPLIEALAAMIEALIILIEVPVVLMATIPLIEAHAAMIEALVLLKEVLAVLMATIPLIEVHAARIIIRIRKDLIANVITKRIVAIEKTFHQRKQMIWILREANVLEMLHIQDI